MKSKLTISIDDDLKKKVQHAAVDEQMTTSKLVVHLLRFALENWKGKPFPVKEG